MRLVWFGALALLHLLSACAAIPNDSATEAAPSEVLIEFFFATDRLHTGSPDPADAFGSERGSVSYGRGVVAIPVERARSQFADYTGRNVNYGMRTASTAVLRSLTGTPEENFFADLSHNTRTKPDKSVLVYIHGYGRRFATSARNAALVAYEVGYQGTPVVYSWPSKGSAAHYVADSTTVEWSTPHLRDFIRELAQRTDATAIHLVAHSMGNRALLKALSELVREPGQQETWKIGEIVLLAPDVDRAIFERDYAPQLLSAGARLTLYVSSMDIPLMASKQVHTYPRLGDARDGPFVLAGVETIDATAALSIVESHSYYRENPAVMADLHYLLSERRGARDRPTLERIDTRAGSYWRVRADWPPE